MGRVAVMGAGSWGTAFALLCADAGQQVTLWTRRAQVAEAIARTRHNPAYLTGVTLPAAVSATAHPGQALAGAQLVVLAVPSHALAGTLAQWAGEVPREAVAVSLVKGIEPGTLRRGSQIVSDLLDLPAQQITVVSGPNLADECARRLPSATVAAGSNPDAVACVQELCHSRTFRVYTNPDVVGVELAGAAKNVVALAAGMSDGLGYGDNTKASLVTRGLAEMSRLGQAYGAAAATFAGLAGMGDLVATCMSAQSRNRFVGEQLGRGSSIQDATAGMAMVAEGVRTAPALLALAERRGVEMPIVEAVVRVVEDGRDPRELVESLMGREPKAEHAHPAVPHDPAAPPPAAPRSTGQSTRAPR